MDREKMKHARPSRKAQKRLPKGLEILHEDQDILVAEKPPGMLTMATDKGDIRTAYFYLTDYVRKGVAKSKKRIFIVHRLDKDASGILVFAKTEPAKYTLQSQWQDSTKKYLAVVRGRFENQIDTLRSYLAENQAFKVYSTPDASRGKLALTAYAVRKETAEYSLLEIDLLTGRKHQIRVQLAESGHPIVGDKKYGEEGKGHARLALHAYLLSFRHPATGEMITFETKMPGPFGRLVKL
jgi:23S rRNA pseudouridine1911/1915/1917 synthase